MNVLYMWFFVCDDMPNAYYVLMVDFLAMMKRFFGSIDE